MKAIESRAAMQAAAKRKFTEFKTNGAREGMSAGSRLLTEDLCPVFHLPKFQIDRSEKFFTIGSCFAREVEERLLARNIQVLGSDFSLPERYRVGGRWERAAEFSQAGLTTENARSCLNKYSVHSMAQCLALATNYTDDILRSLLIETPAGYINPHQHLPLSLPQDDSLALFRDMMAVYQTYLEADTFVMTLGQTELWFDNATKTVLNGTPPLELLRWFPNRFYFCMPTFFEIHQELKRIEAIIATHCSRKPRVILTVSPVPFARTFTGEDALMANQRSKSSLLVAARNVCDEHEDWDYFPSYEMVTNSRREWAIEPDGIHVMPRCVERVVGEFCRLYFPEAAVS